MSQQLSAGDGVETRLALFELAENSILRKISKKASNGTTTIGWERHQHPGPRDGSETAHAGYFDLLLKKTVTRDSDPPEKRTQKTTCKSGRRPLRREALTDVPRRFARALGRLRDRLLRSEALQGNRCRALSTRNVNEFGQIEFDAVFLVIGVANRKS